MMLEKEVGNNYLVFLHEFPLSAAKLEYAAEILKKGDFRSTFFPFYEYELSYELSQMKHTAALKAGHIYDTEDLKSDTQEYHENGFIERFPVEVGDFPPYTPVPFEAEGVLPENEEALLKLIRFCKEKGITFIAVAAPMYGGSGKNIGFKLSESADVTISLVNGKVRVQATKPLTYRTIYIAGNASVMGNWSPNAVALTNDQITFSNLAAEWYEFKITQGSWNPQWGYSDLDVANSSPMHKTYGDGNNICFRLQAAADVTIKMENGKVVLLIDRDYCITGNGNDIDKNVWLKGKKWAVMDEDAKLDANYSRTFANLPAGTYKFKVKEYADGWNDDCTWGYDHLDTENSIECTADGSNIAFTLTSLKNVTIALVNNKIRVTAENVTPTAMDNVTFRNNGKYYDILGREVSHPQPGNLYIHNGKKILF